MTGARPVDLIGVSIPRSGHHHLARLLQATLGEALSYCPFYTAPQCCRAHPCTRETAALLRYQKNHDFEFTVPRDLPGVRYLIQVREPVAEALSDRELVETTYGAIASDADHHLVWLAQKAVYLRRFWDKWLREPRANAFVLDYDRLQSQPVASVAGLLAWLGLGVDESRVVAAVESVGGFRDDQQRERFVPRRLELSRHWDADLYDAYAQQVAFFRPAPLRVGNPEALSASARAETLRLVCLGLTDANAPGDLALQMALGREPHNVFLREVMARRANARGDVERALALMAPVEEAVHRYAPMSRFVAELWRRAGDVPGAVACARRAVELAPSFGTYRIFLGSLLAESGQREVAAAEAAAALTGFIEDPRELLVAAHLRFGIADYDGGLAALDRAIAMGLPAAEWQELRARVVRYRSR